MAVRSSVSPVCPITRPQARPLQPSRTKPDFPKVQDLPSVINTLNQIILYLNGPADDITEYRRVTEIVRVYNPNDREQWVDVERINYLDMRDSDTGSKVTFKYK